MVKPLGLACSVVAVALAQPPQPGAQILNFHSDVDGSDQPYALYLPRSFDPARKYPLVISLHSEESNHRLNLRQVFGISMRFGQADPPHLQYFPVPRDYGFIVAAPLARGTMGYRGIAEKDVYDVLDDVERRFPVDRDRVYLTGISMGGAGALRFALTRPDVWAAVAPLCPTPAPEVEELAPNALNLPIRLVHGDQDPIVPVENSRKWQRRLLDAGDPVEYIEYPGQRHNVWDLAWRGGGLFEWLGQHRRDRFPERVRFRTSSYRYDSAYWVRIDGLTPGVPAGIDARRTGTAEIRVETANLDGFTLSLDRPASLVTIDGAPVRVKPAESLSFTKASGSWRPGRYQPAGKRPGAEGPISEALSGRQIYVYGTLGAATAEDLAARRKTTETAAAWSTIRSRLTLALPVKADTEVTAADLAGADLILFGTGETNSVIARLASSLPLSLSPAAADYGLLFIAPQGTHYVLVNSGLPWWTGADEAHRSGEPFAPSPYRSATTFGDFIFFKGSLSDVVSEGRFDRNWKVPPDASAKMRATGTVTVR